MTVLRQDLFFGPCPEDGGWEVGVYDYASGEARVVFALIDGTPLCHNHAGTMEDCLALLRATLDRVEAGAELATAFRLARQALFPRPAPSPGSSPVVVLSAPRVWTVGAQVAMATHFPSGRVVTYGAVILGVGPGVAWVRVGDEENGYVLRVPAAEVPPALCPEDGATTGARFAGGLLP